MNSLADKTEHKQGYKKTELGWIPEEWDVFKIGDLCQVKRGASPRPIKDPRWWGNSAGWVRISDVTASRKYLNSTQTYLSEEGIKQSVKVNKGEVILSICATMGVPIIVNMDACIHDGFVWFDKLTQEIDREFLYYFLQYNTAKLASNKQTGTQGNLNTSIIANALIPFMQKQEQQKIAEILSNIDKKINYIDNQIGQAEKLKKALMQELLTKGIGHTEFKETEIGRIPKKWQVLTLSEFASKEKNAIVDGPFGSNLKTEHYRTEGIPIIQSGFVTNNKFIANNYIYVDGEKFEKEIRSKVSPNDIVMAKIGANCGRCAIMPKTHPVGILAGNSLKITVSINNSTYYLLKLLHYYLEIGRFEELISRTAQPALSIGRLKTLKIPCPELLEQEKIATMAESIDEKIEILQNKKSEYEKLKKGLMQKLLTGQIRVRV